MAVLLSCQVDSVINRIPDYLKLFTDEDPEIVEEKYSIPEVARFCRAFPEVTGLNLEIVETSGEQDQLSFPWSPPRQANFKVSIEPTSRSKVSSLADTREFEDTLASLLNLLAETQGQLRQREAELAATVPVVSVEEDGQHLADRLFFVLRGAAEMMNCSGAAIYMLDEATTSLKLRSSFGLDESEMLSGPRQLEDAVADIEALAGHAVVIEDVASRQHWQVPHACKAAMCVPISTATTILGTLWMFRDHAADFSPNEQNLAEITAGRLSADLERAVLIHEVRSLRGHKVDDVPPSISTPTAVVADESDLETVEAWHQGRIGKMAPFVEGWDIADSIATTSTQGDFCHWHVAKQERLHLAIGASHRIANKSLSSIAFQAAHAAHTQHDPTIRALFEQTNQSLWASSIEGDESSLFHAILDPTCGRLQYTIAGGVYAYIIRPHAWEPLLASPSPLGVDCEFTADIHQQLLMPGDILLAVSNPSAIRDADDTRRTNQIAEHLLRNTHQPAEELADWVSARIQSSVARDQGLAVLIAKRQEQS